jgi:hypothetical protein
MAKTYRSGNLHCEVFSRDDQLTLGRVTNYHVLGKGEDGKDEEGNKAEKFHVFYACRVLAAMIQVGVQVVREGGYLCIVVEQYNLLAEGDIWPLGTLVGFGVRPRRYLAVRTLMELMMKCTNTSIV